MADQGEVVAGSPVTFSGSIVSNSRSCIDNEFVRIQQRVLGTTTFEDIGGAQTDSEGRFTFERRLTESADYLAFTAAHDDCQADSSTEVTVLVKVKLQILASDRSPARGDRIRFKSSVRPQHDGTTLLLQRRQGGRWVTVERDRLNRRSIGQFTVEANFKRATFRTRWKSQDDEHEGNTSRRLRISTTNR